jgi:hypothetical protein
MSNTSDWVDLQQTADSPISQLAAQQKGSRRQRVLFIELDTLWVPKQPYRRRIHCYTARVQQKGPTGRGRGEL